MIPKDAFELMIWERLFAALLTNPEAYLDKLPTSKVDVIVDMAELADAAFNEYNARASKFLNKKEQP